ncbi:MAG: GNAT family N-acetyltransferase [Candidatus Lokiarchaeota archaeon]|nr:GNAT family N-acetyltransferase [Candidatus Lokiarchaeota archaeon]
MMNMYHGDLVRLRKLRRADAEIILKHWNDYSLRQYLPSPLPTSLNDLEEFILSRNESYSKRESFTFGIETIENDRLIGLVDLTGISWISRFAEVSQIAIFDPEFRGKGFGLDSLRVTLDFAFFVLDLHAVHLWVEDFNTSAISFYKKFGFKTSGTLRELVYRDGSRYDVKIMDILKEEFEEKYGILPK